MANQIEREAWVKQDKLKNPIHYVRGTDLLPIVFHFRDFSIPSGATARVFVAKSDGNAVYDSATIEGNDVTVDVTEQMFLVLGMTLMQISIFDGEEELVTFAQPVMVEQNLKAGDLPKSTTDVSFLDDAIEQANQAVNTATTAAAQAAQAVQNANQAIADANEAISDLNEQIASLNTNFASLSNNVSISQLQTTAKTLVGAVNELNGKMIPDYIKNNIDYNDLPIGFHYCGTGCTNSPGDYYRVICLYSSNSDNDKIQVAYSVISGIMSIRTSVNTTWKEWKTFSDDDTVLKSAQNMVLPNYKAASESDADNYMDNYSNPLPNDTHYFTIVNLSVLHSSLGGGHFLVEGTKTTNQWEWQKATTYNATSGINIHARTKSNGAWGEWKRIFPSS